MKIVTFNVNSIRKRLESGQIQKLIEKHQPDIIGLQETKVTDTDFPEQDIRSLGYDVSYMGEPTHYGVAIMVRHKILDIQKGFPNETQDTQCRFIEARFTLKNGSDLHVINGYFPQGENRSHERKFPYKQRFYARLMKHLQEKHSPNSSIAIIGDMNIAPQDIDIGIGEDNKKRWLQTGKCAFLPEEREMMNRLMAWGLEDTFRRHQPDNKNTFSWFDYRSRGFEREPKRGLRIDLILASKPLQEKCVASGIDYEIRSMQSPSDHAPVWASFDI